MRVSASDYSLARLRPAHRVAAAWARVAKRPYSTAQIRTPCAAIPAASSLHFPSVANSLFAGIVAATGSAVAAHSECSLQPAAAACRHWPEAPKPATSASRSESSQRPAFQSAGFRSRLSSRSRRCGSSLTPTTLPSWCFSHNCGALGYKWAAKGEGCPCSPWQLAQSSR